jgi:hypothetical protein
MRAKELEALRRAVADYMWTEGCGCCESHPEHQEAAAKLAALLEVPPYKDKSGYDFQRFRSASPQ